MFYPFLWFSRYSCFSFFHIFRISVSWGTLYCFLWHLFSLIFLPISTLFVWNILSSIFILRKGIVFYLLVRAICSEVLLFWFGFFFFMSYHLTKYYYNLWKFYLLYHLFSNIFTSHSLFYFSFFIYLYYLCKNSALDSF